MRPLILFREIPNQGKDEIKVACKYFDLTDSRMDIEPNDLVIGRYSVLPFYEEMERDIMLADAKLINTLSQHKYIANLMEWYEDLEGLTPRSWPCLEVAPIEGPFVLKGETNSRKFQWDTHMFAKNRRDAANICVELQNDSLICSQNVVVREYIPLKTYMTAIHGLPITKEFRVFVAYVEILSGGYYWSSHVEDLPVVPSCDEVPKDFLREVIERISNKASFYAIDVAQTEKGDWIVVELNDGQMSGLSENKPEALYKNLRRVVDKAWN